MKHKVVVEYEYPVEHKTPVKAELILHGDSVETWDVKPLKKEPKAGYISIDDVMAVFDDFMCGEVDEEGTETFLEMLKDKAESEVSE